MTERQGDSTRAHYIELLDRLIAAPDDKARSEILARNKAERAHIPKSRPVMPSLRQETDQPHTAHAPPSRLGRTPRDAAGRGIARSTGL
jgi:hypothetical protein